MSQDNFQELKLKDLKLIHKAVRNRWAISDELKNRLIEKMCYILENGEDKEALVAAKTIVAAEAQNQKDEIQENKEASFKEQVLAVAKSLGILAEVKKLTKES